jgi:hypothetical protein
VPWPTLVERVTLRIRTHHDHTLAVEMGDLSGSDALRDVRQLGQRRGDRAALRVVEHDRQVLEIARLRARRGREANSHVARLAARIHPVADVHTRERRAQRLRDLRDRDVQCAGNVALELDLQLGHLTLGRQCDVDRARHLARRARDALG